MRKLSLVVHGLIAIAMAGTAALFWFLMTVNGDAPWNTWRRSFDIAGMYIDLYALLLITVFALPGATFCALHVFAGLRGRAPGAGIRWTSNVLAIMFLAWVVVVSVRFEVWEGFVVRGESAQPAVPSDEGLDYPDLPLPPEQAFTWPVTDLAGNTVDVADLKGKTVFINIWATWCGFCIHEFPNIENLYADYRDDENVVFLLVTKEDEETVQTWLDGPGAAYNLPFYRTEDSFPTRFSVRGYPSTFIVGPDGRVVFQHTGAAQWDGERSRRFLAALSRGEALTWEADATQERPQLALP